MAFTKRYAAYHDLPLTDTPVDAQAMNNIESALLSLFGVAPITNGAMVWDGSQFRADAKIKDANVDAAAAIAASKIAGPTFGVWTPTLTQGVAVTFTTNYAKYWQFGKLIVAECNLGITGAGTAGSQITVGGLPAAAFGFFGAMMYFDTGTSWYHGGVQTSTATSCYGAAHGVGNPIGVTPNFGAANGDALMLHVIYEGA